MYLNGGLGEGIRPQGHLTLTWDVFKLFYADQLKYYFCYLTLTWDVFKQSNKPFFCLLRVNLTLTWDVFKHLYGWVSDRQVELNLNMRCI